MLLVGSCWPSKKKMGNFSLSFPSHFFFQVWMGAARDRWLGEGVPTQKKKNGQAAISTRIVQKAGSEIGWIEAEWQPSPWPKENRFLMETEHFFFCLLLVLVSSLFLSRDLSLRSFFSSFSFFAFSSHSSPFRLLFVLLGYCFFSCKVCVLIIDLLRIDLAASCLPLVSWNMLCGCHPTGAIRLAVGRQFV